MAEVINNHLNNELKVTCTICIATYKRPDLLRQLIMSLLNQEDTHNLYLELVIVDNDKDQSAKPIVSEFNNNTTVNIFYFNQPLQNISLTRNVALDNASGQYIAIIDDDETADPHWLRNLVKTALKYNADAVFGFVDAIFPNSAPDWMRQREIFFQPTGKTGDNPRFWYTTNCLINNNFIDRYKLRFDPKYGLSGGEDGFFFESMKKRGARFVVCREAISYESIPEYRATLKFIYLRFFQRGNNFGLIKIGKNNKFQIARLLLFSKALTAVIFFGLQMLIFSFLKKKWIFAFIGLSSNLGKLSAVIGKKYFIYKNQ